MNENVYFPLCANSKIPAIRDWQRLESSVPILSGHNTAMRCLATVVIDTDSELATELALLLLPRTKRVKTRKGMHFYFRGSMLGKKNLRKVDIIGTSGYVVAPPSVIDGHLYRFVDDCSEAEWSQDYIAIAEKISALTTLAEDVRNNFYAVGQRDKIIFALSGTLRKAGIDISVAEKIIRYIAAGDEELKSRIEVLRRTYAKPTTEITGIKALRELNVPIPRIIKQMTTIETVTTQSEPKKRKTAITNEELMQYLTQRGTLVRYDDVKDLIYVNDQVADDVVILDLFAQIQYELAARYTVNRNAFFDVIITLAHRNRYNSLKERLQKCYETYRLHADTLDADLAYELALAFRTADPKRDALKIKHFFAQAVNRALEHGSEAKYVLVLTGKQNARKTTACKVLNFDGEYYVSVSSSFDDEKDFILRCRRGWLVELEEGVALKRSEINTIKTLISRNTDVIRLPYDRIPKTLPRGFCLIVTTNESEILRDTTGNVRFLVLNITDIIDIDKLRYYRDLFFGYCYDLVVNQAFQHQIIDPVCYEMQAENETIDELEALVYRALIGDSAYFTRGSLWSDGYHVFVDAVSLAKAVCEVDEFAKVSRSTLFAIRDVMQRFGFSKRRVRRDYQRCVCYVCSKDAIEELTQMQLAEILANHNAEKKNKIKDLLR